MARNYRFLPTRSVMELSPLVQLAEFYTNLIMATRRWGVPTRSARLASQLNMEIQLLLAAMRQNSKWVAGPRVLGEEVEVPEDPLILNLKILRRNAFLWASGATEVSGMRSGGDAWERGTAGRDATSKAEVQGDGGAARAESSGEERQAASSLASGVDGAGGEGCGDGGDEWDRVDPLEYLAPFLTIIRSEKTNTAATGVALAATHKILTTGFFLPSTRGAARAMHAVVEAVTGCRFEVTDHSSEEVVLMKILQVLVACLTCPAGELLSDRDVCSVVNTCFRVVHQSALRSDVLQRAACAAMHDMVRTIFARLPSLPSSPASGEEEMQAARSTEGTMVLPDDGALDAAAAMDAAAAARLKEGVQPPGEEGVAAAVAHAEGGGENGGSAGQEGEEKVLQGDESNPLLPRDTAGAASAASPSGSESPGSDSGSEGDSQHEGAPGDESSSENEQEEGEEYEEEESSAVDFTREVVLGRPYGAACLVEVFHFLCSLLTLDENLVASPRAASPRTPRSYAWAHAHEDMPLFALQLISTALDLTGEHVALHPRLLALVSDDLFRSFFLLAASPNPLVFPLICSIVLRLFLCLRRHLKLQLEAFFLVVLARAAQERYAVSFQQQEAALEALLDFCRLPEFAVELYSNYDCDISRSNLLEDLGGLLSKSAFPVASPLTSLHVLALDGLLEMLRHMAHRVDSGPAPKPPAPPSYGSGRQADGVEFWTCQWGPPPPTTAAAAAGWGDKGDAGPGKQQGGETGEGGGEGAGARSSARGEVGGWGVWEAEGDWGRWVEFVRARKHVKRRLLQGAEHFNRDPARGLQYLQAAKLLPEELDARNVACFFRYTPGLSKRVLGDYLGDHEPFKVAVLHEFARLFDFSGLALDGALRTFLESFRLPGEAQKIARVLEAFAARYYEQCPDVLASRDAAYILSYSVIMLNTDQHNGQVRHKMTEEEFIRNNRMINDGTDLPRDMLTELYHSIARDEIRVSADSLAGGGSGAGSGAAGEMSYSRWMDIVRRAPSCLAYVPCGDSRPLLDHDIFAAISGPAIAAMSVVYDHSDSPDVLRQCLQGFMDAAKICAAHCMRDALDDLVVSLCKFTTLLNPAGGEEEAALAFAEDAKATMAAAAVFTVANRYGDYIRTGWRNVLDCVLRLHKLGLLPVRVLLAAHDGAGQDELVKLPFTGDASSATSTRAAMQHRDGDGAGGKSGGSGGSGWGRGGGLMLRFSQLFLLDSEEEQQPSQQLLEAQRQVLRAMEECRIEAIFADSKFLQADSLLHLAKALIWAASSGRPLRGGSGVVGASTADEEDTAVFCLSLLVAVTLTNRDRILLLWPAVADHLAAVVETATAPTPLVEKAVFGLLRLCRRLVPYKEDVADELLRSLHLILRLDARLADVLCERITKELLLLVQAHAAAAAAATAAATATAAGFPSSFPASPGSLSRESGHIRSAAAWRTLCSLLAVAARHPDAAAAGFEALRFAMDDGSTVPSLQPTVSSLHRTMSRARSEDGVRSVLPASLLPCLDAAVEFVESRAGGPERSVKALELLLGLLRPLQLCMAEVMAQEVVEVGEGGEEARQAQLKEVWDAWSKLASVVARTGTEQREAVRNAAIAGTQQVVMGAAELGVPVRMRVRCVEEVVLPLLDGLLDTATREKPREFKGMEGSLILALKLLTCAFLSLLPHLLPTPPSTAPPHPTTSSDSNPVSPAPSASSHTAHTAVGLRQLWLAVLQRLERCSKHKVRAALGGGEALQREVGEAVRGLLQSMVQHRVLLPPAVPPARPAGSGGDERERDGEGASRGEGTGAGEAKNEAESLWEVTWRAVGVIAPGVTVDEMLPVDTRGPSTQSKEGQEVGVGEGDYVLVGKEDGDSQQ
ncbi:unnamed protein product [Closterium sp. Yama58-4]|nr:unnamed protein product [Closterium sp. Yama58-4]